MNRGTLIHVRAYDSLRRDGVYYPDNVQVSFWDGRPGGFREWRGPIWSRLVKVLPNGTGAIYRSETPVPQTFRGDPLVVCANHSGMSNPCCCHPSSRLSGISMQPIGPVR